MTLSTPNRRVLGWFVFAVTTLGLLFFLSFRTQAQPTKSKAEKGKQATTAAPGKSYAEGRLMEMDRLTEEELMKAQAELEKAQRELSVHDWAKIDAEMARASAEVERALVASKAAIERDVMKKAMAQVERELAASKGQMEHAMRKAQVEMEHAQKDLKLMEEGMQEMQKDGLIKKGESVELKWDGDTMILNGQRQPAAVSEKYKKYFNKRYFDRKPKDYRNVEI